MCWACEGEGEGGCGWGWGEGADWCWASCGGLRFCRAVLGREVCSGGGVEKDWRWEEVCSDEGAFRVRGVVLEWGREEGAPSSGGRGSRLIERSER